MPADPLRILIVDANRGDASRLQHSLDSHGFASTHRARGKDALALALTGGFEAVITESDLEDDSGLSLISQLHSKLPRVPVIMLTHKEASNTAIEAIKSGAYDYLQKPADFEELVRILREAISSARRMSKPVEIGQVYPEQDTILGHSRLMTEVYKELGRVASKPVTVLIRGETGTGKELIARAIYQHGHRPQKPFVAINCAAIPAPLLEAELFGHEKGAFTGADKLRIGRFEQAHNGTLFLDEIGDMDLHLQAKLLRVLQEKRIRRVGGVHEIPVDVRIIAATHRDLEEMIDAGTFRPDLYYRLNVAAINIPPLRNRREDLPPLVEHYLQHYGEEYAIDYPSITSQGLKFLEQQDWPGNVRQLQNVLRKALLGSRGYPIGWTALRDIYEESQAGPATHSGNASLRQLVADTLQQAAEGELPAVYPVLVETLERELLAAAIKRSGGNQAQAARWLGISRFTLREKLHRYQLHPGSSSSKEDPPGEKPASGAS